MAAHRRGIKDAAAKQVISGARSLQREVIFTFSFSKPRKPSDEASQSDNSPAAGSIIYQAQMPRCIM